VSQSGPLPYLHACGVEVANAARVVEYLRNGLGDTMQGHWELGPGEVCRALYRSFAAALLTLSGNEITDALRTLGLQGDGRTPPDSSVGIWEATTNLHPNSDAASNTTSHTPFNSTIARVAGGKFGPFEIQVTSSAAGGAFDFYDHTIGGATAGRIFSETVWVKGIGSTIGTTLSLRLHERGGAQPVAITTATIVLTGSFQRLTVSRTVVENDRTAIRHEITWTAAGAGEVVAAGGYQIEEKRIPTPNVRTDGASATRAAARVQALASLLDETQGWVAFRLRMGWGTSVEPYGGAGFPELLIWGDDATHVISIFYDEANNRFEARRNNGVGASGAQGAAVSFAKGDSVTVVAAWTATQIKISVNASAFASLLSSTVPTLAATTFDVGSGGTLAAGRHIDSDVLWLVGGIGTLAEADAVTLHAFGDTDPGFDPGLPPAARPTFVWPADDATAGSCTPLIFGSPSADPAPWYDADEPGSATFLGVVLLDIDGYDSTIVRSIAERTAGLGGGVFGSQRRSPRVWRFRAALVSADPAGAEYGLRWLTSVLQASACDTCETCDLTVRLLCPDADCSDESQGQWTSYDVALTSGPTEVETFAPGSPEDALAGCRDLVIVEWTMTAANPFLYRPAEVCTNPAIIGFEDPACEDLYSAPGAFYPASLPVGSALQPPGGTVGEAICCQVTPPARGVLGAIFTLDSPSGMGSVLLEAHVQCPATDDEPVLQMQLSEIPMDSVVVVDGARHTVTVTTVDPLTLEETTTDGLYLVTLPVGRGLEWIEVRDCDDLHCVCARIADGCAGGADTTVQISTQIREG